MATPKMDSTALFTQYVDVVNKSLDMHKGEFPYKQLLKAADSLLEDKTVAVAIYKDDADEPHDWFTMGFDHQTFQFIQHGKTDANLTWRAKEDYIRNVVENPKEYIESPSKLEFGWLKSRVGLD